MKTLQEIKNHNKRVGGHFFDRGNAPIISKQGNYLVTLGMSNDGYVIYKYNERTGAIDFVDNPKGDYSWQPYPTKNKAIFMAKSFARGEK